MRNKIVLGKKTRCFVTDENAKHHSNHQNILIIVSLKILLRFSDILQKIKLMLGTDLSDR